jgi:hypothetical protein
MAFLIVKDKANPEVAGDGAGEGRRPIEGPAACFIVRITPWQALPVENWKVAWSTKSSKKKGSSLTRAASNSFISSVQQQLRVAV